MVAEGGRGPGLAEEAVASLTGLEVGGEDLDRNRALELHIPGAVDDAHATAADLLIEAVAVRQRLSHAAGRQHVDAGGGRFDSRLLTLLQGYRGGEYSGGIGD